MLRLQLHVYCAVAALAACGPGASAPDFALTAVAGTYNDGSGSLGLVALVALRDQGGTPPEGPWIGELEDRAGARGTFEYPAGASHAVLFWPDVPVSPADAFTLRLTSSEAAASVAASVAVPDSLPLSPPLVELSADGETLQWAADAAAPVHRCQVLSGTSIQLDDTGPADACDLSALPPGAYTASVLALSADIAPLSSDSSMRPALPPALHLAEGRLAFARGGGTVIARAAGGQMDYGGATTGLAFHLSIADPSLRSWSVSVVGPGLPASNPLRTTYPAGAPHLLTWTYDVPALPGRYSLSATSTDGLALATQFEIGTPALLDRPTDVSPRGLANGAASVSWAPVSGARSYYVSVWDHQSATFASGRWVADSSAAFSSGTFTAGRTYDVYVAAADVDMTSPPPAQVTQVSLTENTYLPASFTAP